MPEDKVPEWVPQVGPQAWADVYPVSPLNSEESSGLSPPDELRLDRNALVHGYSERRRPYEFSSCLPSSERTLSSVPSDGPPPSFTVADLVKLRDGLTTLRKSRPTNLQRIELLSFSRVQPHNNAQQNKKTFPLQKPTTTSSLEEWFSSLSSNFPVLTVSLTRTVPLGPTIGRSTGKVVEMMASRSVPTQRAVWYIRIAVLNECVKNQRPDRPALSPRSFWTQQLSNFFRSDVNSLNSRQSSLSGPMSRVALWRYILDLVRWQVDEGLVDLSQWLKVIADVVRAELNQSQTLANPGTLIAMLAARRFLPEFLSDNDNACMLCEALLPAATEVVKAWHSPVQSRDQLKNPKGNIRKLPKRNFVPNQCHSEITFLLDAIIRVLDPASLHNGAEFRLGDLEQFTNRGIDIMKSIREERERTRDAKSFKETSFEVTHTDTHEMIRELERLPAHGDIAHVVSILQSGDMDFSRSNLSAVKVICQWAVDGPVHRTEAITVASAVLARISALREQLFANQSSNCSLPSPMTEWRAGNMNHGMRPGSQNHAIFSSLTRAKMGTNSGNEPPLHRELWQYFKEYSKGREPRSPQDGNHIVRFLARLFRVNLLSLSSFVRDVSRLSACGQPGAGYLIKCLSLLPDPADSSMSDSRRALLRKYGYASNSRVSDSCTFKDTVLRALNSGNVAGVESQAESLMSCGNINAILSTSEAVCLERAFERSDNLPIAERRVRAYSIVSFLVHVDEPGMAVEWVLEQLIVMTKEGDDCKGDIPPGNREEMMSVFISLVGDLSRYIAASGNLEMVFNCLKDVFLSTWATLPIREHILRLLSSMAAIFNVRADRGSMYWTRMVARVLKQGMGSSNEQLLIPLAAASLRGLSIVHMDNLNLSVLLDTENPDNQGLSPDVDLQITTNLTRFQGMDVSKLRNLFSSTSHEFPLDGLLTKMTMNDVLGSVFIPVLSEFLTDPNIGSNAESLFSRLATKVLEMFKQRRLKVRLQGIRPSLVIDFMALITAGCACVHMHPSDSLDVLVQMDWIWKILVPRAGVKLARRLRARVDYYCEKAASTEKGDWIDFLSNMVLKVYGEPGRDEIAVCSTLGNEPFGMVEMELAFLAFNRHEREEDEEFGSRVSDAACLDKESAKTLTNMALECSFFTEEDRQSMAKVIAFNAVQKMGESLRYVVSALTMETSRSTAIYLERARQWYDADRARRTVLGFCIDSLSENVGSQVEAFLYDQLSSIAKKLSSAMASGCLPSDLLTGGQQISNALESRLTAILRSKRAPQSLEWWKQRCVEIAHLLKGGVALLKTSAILCCLKVLEMCIYRVGDSLKVIEDKPGADGSIVQGGPSKMTLTCRQVLNHPLSRDLRADLLAFLKPTLFWIEGAAYETVSTLIGAGTHGTCSIANKVHACDEEGSEIDNWILLEGYGRGVEESPAVAPSAFWRQGEDNVRSEERRSAVKLKKTYTTYSSLAIQ